MSKEKKIIIWGSIAFAGFAAILFYMHKQFNS